jgi:hypothetical protein
MDTEKSLLKEFISGGWVVPLVGALAMFARLLTAPNPIPVVQQIKKIAAAAVASGIAWFVLEQTDIGSLTKAVTYGIIGVISPEIINGIVKLGKRFEKNPINFIEKE